MITPEQAEIIREQLLKQIEKLPEEQKQGLVEQIESASPEQLESFIKQGKECLFCEIAKGNVETFKIYEDAGIIAFLDITPAAAGQTMIIPKEHWQFIFQVPDQILWDMTRIMKLLMPIIVNVTKCQGISTYIAQGPAAGQRIGHAAINLIPRFEEDKAVFAWDRKEVPKEQLEKAAKEIRISLEKTFAEEKAKLIQKVKQETPAVKTASSPEKLPEYPRRRA